MNASGEGSGTRNGKRHARGHPAMARPACETPGGIRGRPGSWSRLMSPGATSTLTPPGRTGNSPCLKRRVRQTAEPGHRSTGSMGKGQAARGPQSDHCAAVRHAGNQRVSGMVGGRRSAVGGRNGALATTFFRCGRSLRWLGDGDRVLTPGGTAGVHGSSSFQRAPRWGAGRRLGSECPGVRWLGGELPVRGESSRLGAERRGDKPVASGMAATRAGAPRGSHPIPRTVRLLDVEGLDHDLGR